MKIFSKTQLILLHTLMLFLWYTPALQAQAFVVVASKASPLPQMIEYQISSIYLDKSREISGMAIEPLDLKEWSVLKEAFYKQVIKKNASQLNAYWARKLFTGRGKPPRSFKDMRALSNYLQKNPQAIAYMPEKSVGAYPVKIIYRQQ